MTLTSDLALSRPSEGPMPGLRQRRQRLTATVASPIVVWSGQPSPRNFPANQYRFRANSHFLYLAGQSVPGAALYLHGSDHILFLDDPAPAAELWHGPMPSAQQVAETMGLTQVRPYAELKNWIAGAASLPVQDWPTQQEQQRWLGRTVPTSAPDQQLVAAMVQLRLTHDAEGISEIRRAVQVSMAAHRAGMAATPQATTEAQVRAAMEQVIVAQDMGCAYNSIVTTHGEVLHNEQYHRPLRPGDLLLADVGAEAPSGWASDITRTWPVAGQFSPTQRDLYDAVLAAHDRCIAQAAPGVEYRDLHLAACHTLAAGLVDLGILRGNPEDLVAQDVHALFFPHGVGHLLGLDVHDMEDLGDHAGYAPGRCRSDRFGLGFLRLDRPLSEGMVVTIEPGFYQVPALLERGRTDPRWQGLVNWERLAQFQDVRGIRIEDDLLITKTGCEVLTADLPTAANAIADLVNTQGISLS